MDMKRKIPFKNGIYEKKSNGEVRLVGSKCPSCKEIFFPKKGNNICVHCQKKGLKKVNLGPYGKVVSFSAAMQRPAGGYFFGQVPYCYGLVDLDEGARIQSHILADVGELYIGMDVELVVETLYEDSEVGEIEFYCFRPISSISQ